jgi:hypothetical protein
MSTPRPLRGALTSLAARRECFTPRTQARWTRSKWASGIGEAEASYVRGPSCSIISDDLSPDPSRPHAGRRLNFRTPGVRGSAAGPTHAQTGKIRGLSSFCEDQRIDVDSFCELTFGVLDAVDEAPEGTHLFAA